MTTKKDGKPKPVGRPTKYHDKMPDKLREFFTVDLFTVRQKEVVTKNGVEVITETKPNQLPTVENFCAENDIHKDTFYAWVKKYPRFSDAFSYAKGKQINHLMQLGLSGEYNSPFAKFIMTNISEYRDKVEQQVEQKTEIKLAYDIGDKNEK